MDCPRCGYAMSDFDAECPRCKRFGLQQAPPQPATKVPIVPPHPHQVQALASPKGTETIQVSHTLAWVAGCCPLIAIGVEFMLGSMGVSSGWAVFGGAMAINSVITYADEAYLKKIGFDTKSLSNAWLIPIYLFARPHVAGGGNGPGILWCILFVLSFLPVFSPLAPPLPDGSQIDTSGTITAIASGSADSGLSSANMGPSVKVKIDRGELSGQVFEVSTQAGDPVLQFPVGSRLRVTGTFHMRSGRMTIDPISLWPAT